LATSLAPAAQVPKFYDTAVLKPEDVDDGRAEVTRLLLHMGMDNYEFALSNCMLHIQDLARILERVLLHPCQKGLCRSFEKWVVVPKPDADELRIGLANFPTRSQLEKRDGNVFVAIFHNGFTSFNDKIHPIIEQRFYDVKIEIITVP